MENKEIKSIEPDAIAGYKDFTGEIDHQEPLNFQEEMLGAMSKLEVKNKELNGHFIVTVEPWGVEREKFIVFPKTILGRGEKNAHDLAMLALCKDGFRFFTFDNDYGEGNFQEMLSRTLSSPGQSSGGERGYSVYKGKESFVFNNAWLLEGDSSVQRDNGLTNYSYKDAYYGNESFLNVRCDKVVGKEILEYIINVNLALAEEQVQKDNEREAKLQQVKDAKNGQLEIARSISQLLDK